MKNTFYKDVQFSSKLESVQRLSLLHRAGKTGGYLKRIKYVLSLWLDTGSFLSSFLHGGQKHAVLNWSPNVDMQMSSKGRPIEKGCLWGSKRRTPKLNKISKIESFQKLWAECWLVSILILRPGDQFNVYLDGNQSQAL